MGGNKAKVSREARLWINRRMLLDGVEHCGRPVEFVLRAVRKARREDSGRRPVRREVV